MKEIDFLPQWYKSGQRRQVSLRAQYLVLGCVFAVMIAWNFTATYRISKASAGLSRQKARQTQGETISLEFANLKSQVTQLQKKAELLEQIDSKIDLASVLAEISFLMGDKIVLSEVQFEAQKFANRGKDKSKIVSAVRVAGHISSPKGSLPVSDVRFKVLMKGVACEPGDVAALVCRLEDSAYFRKVTSSWRNKEIDAGGSAEMKLQASEFRISCYLANYRQESPHFATNSNP